MLPAPWCQGKSTVNPSFWAMVSCRFSLPIQMRLAILAQEAGSLSWPVQPGWGACPTSPRRGPKGSERSSNHHDHSTGQCRKLISLARTKDIDWGEACQGRGSFRATPADRQTVPARTELRRAGDLVSILVGPRQGTATLVQLGW